MAEDLEKNQMEKKDPKHQHFAEYVCSRMGLDYNNSTTVGYEVYMVGYCKEDQASAIFATRELAQQFVNEVEKMRTEDVGCHNVNHYETAFIGQVKIINK